MSTAAEAERKTAIEHSYNYFQEGGVDVSKLIIDKIDNTFTVNGTVEDWKQLEKVNELIEASNADVESTVELEDLTIKNIWMNVTTKGSNLNVRAGAGTNFDIVGKLANGTRINVVRKHQEDWFEVTNGEVTGYCHTNYLKDV